MALPYETTANLPIGLFSITTITGGVTYVVESFDAPSEQVRRIERRDASGDPADFMLREDFRAPGSMVLQLATSSTALPAAGDTFVLDWDEDATAETFVIGTVTPNEDQGESFHTVTVEVHHDLTVT